MSFNTRVDLSSNMDAAIVKMLKELGFVIERSGYEGFIGNETKAELRKIHDNPTVTFLRYLPDLFVWRGNKFFFLELKVMDSPIKYASRVKHLQEISGLTDLSSENIGAVETAAINNYQKLRSIGVEILVIVYCTFNPKLLVAEWENKIVKFHSDNVRIGEGNASFTPYTNVHVDRMRTIKQLFRDDFNIDIADALIESVKAELKK